MITWDKRAWEAQKALAVSITKISVLAQNCENIIPRVATTLHSLAKEIYTASEELSQAVGQGIEIIETLERKVE